MPPFPNANRFSHAICKLGKSRACIVRVVFRRLGSAQSVVRPHRVRYSRHAMSFAGWSATSCCGSRTTGTSRRRGRRRGGWRSSACGARRPSPTSGPRWRGSRRSARSGWARNLGAYSTRSSTSRTSMSMSLPLPRRRCHATAARHAHHRRLVRAARPYHLHGSQPWKIPLAWLPAMEDATCMVPMARPRRVPLERSQRPIPLRVPLERSQPPIPLPLPQVRAPRRGGDRVADNASHKTTAGTCSTVRWSA